MSLRAPRSADLDAVLEVVQARDVADLGAPDYTRADLEQDWRQEGDGLGANARVAVHDGRIRGYAILRRSDALIVVHPRATGHGLGSALLAWSEERERELGRGVHRRDGAASDVLGHALLAAAGYTRTRSFWRMAVRLSAVAPPPRLPAGVAVRTLDPDADAAAVHELDERAFAANADFVAHSFDEFRREHLRAPSLDPALSLVAWARAAPVGFVLTRRWPEEDTGYVDLFAVAPERRRAGLGRALLGHAFTRIAAAGLGTAQLSVASDNPRALTLYESLGMQVRFQIDSFERAPRRGAP
ncbi:MAG TPA: GNAT family N-acetyltransferase [Solirubrobacteraceae bacterium]|nr:GNAT family N-acetyltransferase [Solirubrobacteraceae bacterium]